MRLDLLLTREPFDEIFVRTFGGYLSDRFGWKGAIEWHSGYSSTKNSLLVNSKLNLIYSRNIDNYRLRKLASEYTYHTNTIRRLLQWLYVRYAVTLPCACYSQQVIS